MGLLRIKYFLRRVTPITWAIWLLLLSDLLAPGQWVYGLLVTEIDLTNLVSEVKTAYEGNN